jgi:hypothetical protein
MSRTYILVGIHTYGFNSSIEYRGIGTTNSMSRAQKPPIRIDASTAANEAIFIFLHGFGDEANSWIGKFPCHSLFSFWDDYMNQDILSSGASAVIRLKKLQI